jgi:hypothetical protein
MKKKKIISNIGEMAAKKSAENGVIIESEASNEISKKAMALAAISKKITAYRNSEMAKIGNIQ